MLAVSIDWFPARRVSYVVLPPLEPEPIEFAPFGGTRSNRAQGPITPPRGAPLDSAAVPPPVPVPPVPVVKVDTGPLVPAYDPDARLVPSPAPGDGRLWVSPRPALPAAVADLLYGGPSHRDSVVAQRLQAMIDTLNMLADADQRARRLPSWTVKGEDGRPKFGIDSQFIHVAGIKIPTAVLALLGSVLPQGNYDEAVRNRQLQYMREDILRAADRAQTVKDFRRYVRELRARKDEEREQERRRRAQDTTRVEPIP